LGLASALVVCIDDGGIEGFEPANRYDAEDSDGSPLQMDVRGVKHGGTVRYYPKGALTMSGATASVGGTALVWFGQTASAFVVLNVKPSKTSKAHNTLDVTVEKVTKAATLTHAY